MTQWIDAYAAPLLVLLFMAAIGGFFVFERSRWYQKSATDSSLVAAHGWRWLLLGAVAGAALAWVAWGLVTQPLCALCVNWSALDASAQGAMREHAWWLPLAQAMTQLGALGWMAALAAVTGLWLLVRKAWLLGGIWVLGIAGGGLCVRILKHAVQRERPAMHWVVEQGYSFPSGHSAGAVVCYGLLAWVLWCTWGPRVGRWAVASAVALGVGGSRVLLGAHYLSDVVAGWLLGVGWLALVLAVAAFVRYRAAHVAGGP